MRKLPIFLSLIFLILFFFILSSFLKKPVLELPKINQGMNESKGNENYSKKIPEPPEEGLEKGEKGEEKSEEIHPSNISEGYNISVKPHLEIFDICSGKLEAGSTLGEGGVKICYNDLPPYYIILEEYNSQLNTSFYGGRGFNETYNFSEATEIFRFFIQDLLTVPGWESVEIFGELKNYFSLGDYTLNYIWEPGPEGNLTITKQIMSIPLIAYPGIPKTQEWTFLEFYLKAREDLYYIGKLWFFVI